MSAHATTLFPVKHDRVEVAPLGFTLWIQDFRGYLPSCGHKLPPLQRKDFATREEAEEEKRLIRSCNPWTEYLLTITEKGIEPAKKSAKKRSR